MFVVFGAVSLALYFCATFFVCFGKGVSSIFGSAVVSTFHFTFAVPRTSSNADEVCNLMALVACSTVLAPGFPLQLPLSRTFSKKVFQGVLIKLPTQNVILLESMVTKQLLHNCSERQYCRER